MLTCDCDIFCEAEWYYEPPWDYEVIPRRDSNRRYKCGSCGNLIDHDSLSIRFVRYRAPKSDLESRIYGEDYDSVPLASIYWCERCADLYFSLTELGYCVGPDDHALELVKEYAELAQEK